MTHAPAPAPATADVSSLRLDERLAALRATVASGRLRPAEHRIIRLKALRDSLLRHRDDVKQAMWDDFRKAPESVDKTEIIPVAFEARHAARRVRRWMKPRRASTPLYLLGTTSEIRVEPRGVALIIAPWNYPVNLTLGPLVAAVAAGCAAIVKPSELVPHTAAVIRRIVTDVFPEDEAVVIEGDVDVSRALLEQPFDHIYFTGSPAVGRHVMTAAAKHLSSVTLELGGKSPTIVDETADIPHAARTIAFGKFGNCGQTCVAPDHVYVHRSVADRLAEALDEQVRTYYGEDAAARREGSGYGRIVDARHAERLRGLLGDAIAEGARRVGSPGGDGAASTFAADEDPTYFDPSIVTDVPEDSRLMREELFGPILPIISYDRLEDVIDAINRRPKPLALYVYSERKENVELIIGGTSAGGTLVNDSVIHFLNLSLPFGGVGESGMGKGKGHAGFMAFSNERPVMRQRLKPPMLTMLYPPYTKRTGRLIDLLLRFF